MDHPAKPQLWSTLLFSFVVRQLATMNSRSTGEDPWHIGDFQMDHVEFRLSFGGLPWISSHVWWLPSGSIWAWPLESINNNPMKFSNSSWIPHQKAIIIAPARAGQALNCQLLDSRTTKALCEARKGFWRGAKSCFRSSYC